MVYVHACGCACVCVRCIFSINYFIHHPYPPHTFPQPNGTQRTAEKLGKAGGGSSPVDCQTKLKRWIMAKVNEVADAKIPGRHKRNLNGGDDEMFKDVFLSKQWKLVVGAAKDTKGISWNICAQSLLENWLRLLGPFSCRKSKLVIPKKCSVVHHNTSLFEKQQAAKKKVGGIFQSWKKTISSKTA